MLLSTLAVTCFFASAIGVGLFVRVASRARWLDVPNERSSHDVPTPLGAGVVIVIVASAALAWAAHAGLFHADPTALATLIVAGISAVDDLRSLPSALRLIVHVACAVMVVLTVADAGPRDWSVPLMILAVIWIVGLTNAYNFMDGIDGISGSQAVVAGVAFSLSALHIGLTGPAVAGLAIAAASAGFLVHNWPPARVFMGDVGSAFLGFSFAAMAVQIASWSFASAAAAVLSLWPFVFDATLTFLRRALRGENVLQSHRSHLYQRLVVAGWSHRRVAVMYVVAAVVGAAAGELRIGRVPFSLLLVPTMAGALWALVVWQEALISHRPAGRSVNR